MFSCRTIITTPISWNLECPLGTGVSEALLAFTLGKVIWRIRQSYWLVSPWGWRIGVRLCSARLVRNRAGGAMNLKFSCIDGAGHCQLHVMIEADYDRGDSLAQRVEMLCAFEPAALDQVFGANARTKLLTHRFGCACTSVAVRDLCGANRRHIDELATTRPESPLTHI